MADNDPEVRAVLVVETPEEEAERLWESRQTPDGDPADEITDEELEDVETDVEESKGAPWSGVPLWIARNKIQNDQTWDMDVIFPEVYAEDRTSKLKDLATAQAVGAISHRRMAEQMAKELGFDDYDYDAEIDAIEKEQKELPSSLLGIADQIGTSVLGPAVAGKKGAAGGGGSLNIGQPGPGITSETPLYPKRFDLSGTATARFRALQRK